MIFLKYKECVHFVIIYEEDEVHFLLNFNVNAVNWNVFEKKQTIRQNEKLHKHEACEWRLTSDTCAFHHNIRKIMFFFGNQEVDAIWIWKRFPWYSIPLGNLVQFIINLVLIITKMWQKLCLLQPLYIEENSSFFFYKRVVLIIRVRKWFYDTV